IIQNGNGSSPGGPTSGPPGGGGIRNSGTLLLDHCTIINNNAGDTDGTGGGIFNWPNGSAVNLSLTNCTIQGNSGSSGGGIFSAGASTTTLNNCTVSGNNCTQ